MNGYCVAKLCILSSLCEGVESVRLGAYKKMWYSFFIS
jgi:hypothetical protein